MIRLHAVVEGKTEERFLREVLAPEFGAQGIFVDVHRITTARTKLQIFRGGVLGYGQLKNDLVQWMKQDQHSDAWFTTMVDLYALPQDFPGYDFCMRHTDPTQRVERLEEHLNRDLSHRRFIPYIQLHEFEALLFSEPRWFETVFPGRPAAIQRLEEIRMQFQSPEHIDDRPDLAPSKRILDILPDYRKPVIGPRIAAQIGLARLRQECPHFNQWIAKIESVAAANR
jgi:hypothetical protein